MSNQFKIYISYFLILCITVSLIPLNLLHHHESPDIVCVDLDSSIESDPCHQEIFHSNAFTDFQCDHNTHLDRETEHCEFCELLTTRHSLYLPAVFVWLNPEIQPVEEIIYSPHFGDVSEFDAYLLRGPPA